MTGSRDRPPFANAVFFPLAACYALLVVPWWVATHLGYLPAPAAFTLPAGHAHEMIFGFGVAVVAGYLLGPQPLRLTLMLAASWIVARVAYLGWPGSVLATATAAAFAAGFAARVVPRFGLAAKKWRNRTIAPVVSVLAALTAAAAWAGIAAGTPTQLVLLEGLLVLSVLMFFMGGRIIAPAVAGHLLRHGHPAHARVQPAIEGAVLIVLFIAAMTVAFGSAATDRAAGSLLLCAAVLSVVRIVRWRLWLCRGRPDLWMLVLGYAWLPIGLSLIGMHLWDRVPLTAGVHAIGAGALGSLTLTVMARTRLLYRFRDANAIPVIHAATLMLTVAAVLRLTAPMLADAQAGALVAAAVLWSLAFAIGVYVLLRTIELRARDSGHAAAGVAVRAGRRANRSRAPTEMHRVPR